MKRRNFLSGILALPFVGKAIAANKPTLQYKNEDDMLNAVVARAMESLKQAKPKGVRLIIRAEIPSDTIRVKARIKPEGGGAHDCMDQYREVHDQERYAGHCEFATGWRADPMRKYELVHVKVETPDGWQTIHTGANGDFHNGRAAIIATVNGN